MKLFYKGELCSEATTNNIIFYIIFLSYVYALFLKLINTKTAHWEGIKVEAKYKDSTIEEITRERYFYFYIYSLPLTQEIKPFFIEIANPEGFKYYKQTEGIKNYWDLMGHVYSFAYFFFVIWIYCNGEIYNDAKIMNAASLVFIDMVLELLRIIPKWRNR